jgi:hypothetical protein
MWSCPRFRRPSRYGLKSPHENERSARYGPPRHSDDQAVRENSNRLFLDLKRLVLMQTHSSCYFPGITRGQTDVDPKPETLKTGTPCSERRFNAPDGSGTLIVAQWLPKPRIQHPWPNQRFAVKISKVEAICGKAARTALWGAHSEMRPYRDPHYRRCNVFTKTGKDGCVRHLFLEV